MEKKLKYTLQLEPTLYIYALTAFRIYPLKVAEPWSVFWLVGWLVRGVMVMISILSAYTASVLTPSEFYVHNERTRKYSQPP